MLVYPNPTSGEIRFSTPFKYCEVYDFKGRLISKYGNGDFVTLPQPSGLYLLRVEDKVGAISNHKVIKQ